MWELKELENSTLKKMMIKEKYSLFLILLMISLISCSRRKPIEQVDFDLKRAYHNKVEIQQLNIKKIASFSENGKKYDSIYFDTNLLIKEDFFTDEMKFYKGMKIITENDVFVYENSFEPILVGFKLGYVKLEEVN